MKLQKIANYLKKLIKDFGISLRWNELIDYVVRARHISTIPKAVLEYFNPKLIIREATLNEIKYLATKRRSDFFDYKERFKLKHRCLIAKWKKSREISGYIWIAVNKYRFPETLLKINLGKHEAYLYNGYTFPKYRKKRIFSQLAVQAAAFLLPSNYELIYALVSKTNPAMSEKIMPKWDKVGLRYFKYLKPIRAKSRNPFLQDIYSLYYKLRYFKDLHHINIKE